MGIKIEFLDGDEPRDVKDVQAAILIQNILGVLQIQFERIMISQTDDKDEIVGIDKENWK